jgi:response regulator RpfG family c-di-GMP phosphodiesterase
MVREVDVVARYGGEEFAIILPETDEQNALRLAERAREAIAGSVRLKGYPYLSISASSGIATSTHPSVTSVNDMVNLADRALYVAKRRGRNQVVTAEDLTFDEGGVQVHDVDELRKQVVSLSMQSKDLCLQSIWALVQALEARDPLTARHSRNVRFYVTRLAGLASWSDSLRTTTANAAMLHDLGKIGVPDTILLKNGTFTESEAAVVRRVPLLTCKILEPLRVFETEIVIIRHLRERFDGEGFPDGLAGGNIPIGSRLLAIAETFDALTTDRVHRQRLSVDQALEEIRREQGKQFDPNMVDLLLKTVREQRCEWLDQIEQTRQIVAAATSPANAAPGAP